MEEHEDGGKHFHLAILLGKQRRWKKVKDHIGETHCISVYFLGHKCYYTGYKYAKKYDKHFVCSPGHPKKIQPPQTFGTSSTKKRYKGKTACHTNKDVADLILKENITSRLQLMALAKDTKKRKRDALLYDFLLAKSEKVVSELIETVWAIETAEGHIERERLTRMEILRNALNADSVCKACFPLGEFFCAKRKFSSASMRTLISTGATFSLAPFLCKKVSLNSFYFSAAKKGASQSEFRMSITWRCGSHKRPPLTSCFPRIQNGWSQHGFAQPTYEWKRKS